MDNNPNDLEDILLDIFVDNHVDPSKDWLDLPIEELTKKQFENFKQKRTQSSISEKDQRKEAIADGWYINSLLTLAHERYQLGKDEYLEFAANAATAIVKHSSGHSSKPSSPEVNLSELSPWQEEYLIYLATLFQSVLDLKRSVENGYYIPQEIQSKMGISLNYKRIGEWPRRHIKWQAAAQIFWLDKEANVEKIKKHLLESPMLFELLDLGMLPSVDKTPDAAEGIEIQFRTLEDLIRKVKPGGAKKGRPRKNASISPRSVIISMIYNPDSKELNTEALYIAIETIVKVLKSQKMPLQEVINHPIILQYKSLVPLLETVIETWIMSAFQG